MLHLNRCRCRCRSRNCIPTNRDETRKPNPSLVGISSRGLLFEILVWSLGFRNGNQCQRHKYSEINVVSCIGRVEINIDIYQKLLSQGSAACMLESCERDRLGRLVYCRMPIIYSGAGKGGGQGGGQGRGGNENVLADCVA